MSRVVKLFATRVERRMTSDVVWRLTWDKPAILVVLEARQHAAHVFVLPLLLVLDLVDQRDAALLLFLLLALRLRVNRRHVVSNAKPDTCTNIVYYKGAQHIQGWREQYNVLIQNTDTCSVLNERKCLRIKTIIFYYLKPT